MVKIAVDCRMLNKTGIGVYLENILHYWLQVSDVYWVLIGNKDDIEKLLITSKYEIVECDISIFSIKELFLFPTKKVNKCNAYFTPNFNVPIGIKVPVSITIHDVVFLDYKEFSSRFGSLVRYLFLRRAINVSQKIFTVSNFSKERILAHFKVNKDIIVVYNGIAIDLINFDQNKIENRLYQFNYLLYIGNIKRHKGLDILLDALKNTQLKLVVVGNVKGLKTADDDICKKMKLNPNVIITGRIESNYDLYKLIANADALIQPSRYEGFGLPPLEALYLNTPAIISDIKVFREIYSDMPVVFFIAGDSCDLNKKILSINRNETNKNQILVKYNYQNTAEIILVHLKDVY